MGAPRELWPEDIIARDTILKFHEEETKKCIAFTDGNTLTESEYKNADVDFRNLVELALKRKELIYIVKEDHPRLKELQRIIQSGARYHTFITESYGIVWPLLLRLHLGLKSGFKITSDQLHSMLTVCHWQALGLKVKAEPFFEKDGVSLPGRRLVEQGFNFPKKNLQEFLTKMKSENIPLGEKCVLVVYLDDKLLECVLYCFTLLLKHETKLTEFERRVLMGNLRLISADAPSNILKNGYDVFFNLLFVRFQYDRLYADEGGYCFVLPSHTMLSVYKNTINPNRPLKIVRRAGKFGPEISEYHSDNNERPVGIYAPGISNAIRVHGKFSLPVMTESHDVYHFRHDLFLGMKSYNQFKRAKQVLRQVFPEGFTSEILRSIDRERRPTDDKQYFLDILKYIFAKDVDDEKSEVYFSAVFILIDMVVYSEHWPYFLPLKEKIIPSLFPYEENIKLIEQFTKGYAAKTKNNYELTAILMLCHFYLKDQKMVNAIVDFMEFNSRLPYGWRKKPHSHLYPVLIINHKDYPLEDLKKMNSEARLALFKGFRNCNRFMISHFEMPKKGEEKAQHYSRRL